MLVLPIASRYWQVEVDPADREKTVATPFGIHQFCVMPFGLCNAPGTFQWLMELVLAGLHWTCCLVHLDDIIIFSMQDSGGASPTAGGGVQATWESRPQGETQQVLQMRKGVRYLGHVVSDGRVSTDPEKTKCIAEWPVPTNVKELPHLVLQEVCQELCKNSSPIVPKRKGRSGHGPRREKKLLPHWSRDWQHHLC